MPETLLNVFEGFCDDLPETVRNDLLFMMVMLSDEDIAVDELDDIDERARTLFGARTFMARRQSHKRSLHSGRLFRAGPQRTL